MAAKKRAKRRQARKSTAAPSSVTERADVKAEANDPAEPPEQAAESVAPTGVGDEKPSDFIRRHLGAGKTPTEIVAAAEESGLKFSRALIYAIKGKLGQSSSRRSAERPLKVARSVRRPGGRQSAAPSVNGETEFRRVAFELGIERSRHLLNDLERAIEALIG
jgi:hypothetical protein